MFLAGLAIGNVEELQISIKNDTEKVMDFQNAGGGLYDQIDNIQDVGLSMTLTDHSPENVAIALMGSSAAVAGGTVTAEVFVAHLGQLVRTAKVGISAVTVTNSAGTTTYVAGTDYEVTRSGIIPLSGGTMVEASSNKINYTYPAQHEVEAATTSQAEYYMVFDGLNEARSGKASIVDIWRLKISPADALQLISKSAGRMKINGSALLDDTRPAGKSKYFRVTYVD